MHCKNKKILNSNNTGIRSECSKDKEDMVVLTRYENNQYSDIETNYSNLAFEGDVPTKTQMGSTILDKGNYMILKEIL